MQSGSAGVQVYLQRAGSSLPGIGIYGKTREQAVFLTNLAVSDIIHAGVVLPINFENLSVQTQEFYGGSY